MSDVFKIFFDTEFLEHKEEHEPKQQFGVEAVSIGLVTENGSELYVVFNDFDERYSKPWTVENVLSKLPPSEQRHSKREIQGFVSDWLTIISQESQAKEIEFWARNDTYDAFILQQTLKGMSVFSGFMASLGFDRVRFRDTNEIRKETPHCQLSAQPEAERHIAINDARWERRHYNEMIASLRYQPTLREHFSAPAFA